MKSARRLIYFSAAFVLGFGALFATFQHLGLFEVRGIPVEVGRLIDGDSRAAFAGDVGLKARLESTMRPFKGKRIWEIDIGDMRASIAKDEWVKDVFISRALPNEIRVRVQAKAAALTLVSDKGDFFPVTEDGEVLSRLPATELPDVPLLRGDRFATDRVRRMEVVSFLLTLPERGPLSRRNISEFTWSQEEGYVLTLLAPKVEVRLGDERLELKALRVGQVVNYLTAHNLKGRVIDASFSKKVLVRLRKAQ